MPFRGASPTWRRYEGPSAKDIERYLRLARWRDGLLNVLIGGYNVLFGWALGPLARRQTLLPPNAPRVMDTLMRVHGTRLLILVVVDDDDDDDDDDDEHDYDDDDDDDDGGDGDDDEHDDGGANGALISARVPPKCRPSAARVPPECRLSGSACGLSAIRAPPATGTQLLLDGVFNADTHAGNFLLMPDDRIALIDYGSTKRLKRSERLSSCCM